MSTIQIYIKECFTDIPEAQDTTSSYDEKDMLGYITMNIQDRTLEVPIFLLDLIAGRSDDLCRIMDNSNNAFDTLIYPIHRTSPYSSKVYSGNAIFILSLIASGDICDIKGRNKKFFITHGALFNDNYVPYIMCSATCKFLSDNTLQVTAFNINISPCIFTEKNTVARAIRKELPSLNSYKIDGPFCMIEEASFSEACRNLNIRITDMSQYFMPNPSLIHDDLIEKHVHELLCKDSSINNILSAW